VLPLMKALCVRCHGPEKREAELNLEPAESSPRHWPKFISAVDEIDIWVVDPYISASTDILRHKPVAWVQDYVRQMMAAVAKSKRPQRPVWCLLQGFDSSDATKMRPDRIPMEKFNKVMKIAESCGLQVSSIIGAWGAATPANRGIWDPTGRRCGNTPLTMPGNAPTCRLTLARPSTSLSRYRRWEGHTRDRSFLPVVFRRQSLSAGVH